MKIYLASRFKTVDKVLALAEQLKAAGHIITSTWHDIEAKNPMAFADPRITEYSMCVAARDVDEMNRAQVIVLLSEGCEQTPGGLWFEFGHMYGQGKELILFGPRINVFCYLPAVNWVATEEEVLDRVADLALLI